MDHEMPFNEYNDYDVTSCANGDYNAWEENQVFLDSCDEPEYIERDIWD
jgi:hypothetical protein